jgi:hypothetical protein
MFDTFGGSRVSRGLGGMADSIPQVPAGPAPPGYRLSSYANAQSFVPVAPPAPAPLMAPQPSGYANVGSLMGPVAPAAPPMRAETQTVGSGYANANLTKQVTRMVPATPRPAPPTSGYANAGAAAAWAASLANPLSNYAD